VEKVSSRGICRAGFSRTFHPRRRLLAMSNVTTCVNSASLTVATSISAALHASFCHRLRASSLLTERQLLLCLSRLCLYFALVVISQSINQLKITTHKNDQRSSEKSTMSAFFLRVHKLFNSKTNTLSTLKPFLKHFYFSFY